ncbi:efflux RND transporter periplasmic adaptor subunit [Chelatococcus reniformis]|uniref:MexE family multidrug efflux RND transporter periplasmic adaptor subunit n=1 Tax=Chelatococcus reniformis TaxID=1494448 RepID=A0A916U4S3_9HYPH|nr:efflux RND transporter periplasmic adaptor subunit [Chelatococcus reniformis]GGC58888.1 MexE family multidrug efflux RND transporter periplasmic adaptor subunit [Chelatococcus reniformis]
MTTNSRFRRSAALAAVLAASFGAAQFIASPVAVATAEEPATKAEPATPVSVAVVERRDAVTWSEFSGRLEAIDRVEVRPRVAGAVQAVHFREGALVKQGDLLFTIDPAPYAAEVDRAEAQLVAAKARVTLTKSDLDRGQQLLGARIVTPREIDQRENAAREAAANVRGAEAALQTTRLNLGYTQVRAPVSGRVGRIEVTVGNLVDAGAGAPVLTSLVSINPIYASFSADEDVVARALRTLVGQAGAHPADPHLAVARIPVEMGTAATDGTPYRGKLQLIDNQVDARNGTIRVRALFDNPDGQLIPGQFARLRMGQPKTEPMLLVDERAIGTDQNKRFVLVVGDDHKAVYREVTLGAPIDGLRAITAGLKPGERIVVNGLQRVRPGALVNPQMVAMDARFAAAAKPTTVAQR